MPTKKKRSTATKAKARVKRATNKARKKTARAIAPKRKRSKPKSMTERMKETAQSAIGALLGR